MIESLGEIVGEKSAQTAASSKSEVGIVFVGQSLVHKALHALASTHRLEEVEEVHAVLGGHNLLIGHQTLYAEHGADACGGALVAVGHADDEDASFWEGHTQVLDGLSHLLGVGFVVGGMTLLIDHIESEVDDDEVVGANGGKLAEHMPGEFAQTDARRAAHAEVINHDAALAFESYTIEVGVNTSIHDLIGNAAGVIVVLREGLQMVGRSHIVGGGGIAVDASRERKSAGGAEEESGGVPGIEVMAGGDAMIAEMGLAAGGGEIALGDTLELLIEGALHHFILLQAAEGMPYRLAEGGRLTAAIDPPHSTSAKARLELLAEVARQDVALDERVAEIGNAQGTPQLVDATELGEEMCEGWMLLDLLTAGGIGLSHGGQRGDMVNGIALPDVFREDVAQDIHFS